MLKKIIMVTGRFLGLVAVPLVVLGFIFLFPPWSEGPPIVGMVAVLSYLLGILLAALSTLIYKVTKDQWWQKLTKKSEEWQLNPPPPKEFDLLSSPPEILRDVKKILAEAILDDGS